MIDKNDKIIKLSRRDIAIGVMFGLWGFTLSSAFAGMIFAGLVVLGRS